MEDFKLCDDMVKTEILSRTSLKTLDAIRCTSKEFEKLTYESYILHSHKQRNNMVSGFLMQDYSRYYSKYIHEFAPSRGSNNIDLGFLPRNARILASSEQGLVVFESPHPKTYGLISYYVCKPATKQVVALPNPKTKYWTENVSIVTLGSNPLHYKILRISSLYVGRLMKRHGELYQTYCCEIFDSRTWAWKLMDRLMLPCSVCLDYPRVPIISRGSVYMLLSNWDILKFDAYSEKWSTFSSPIPTPEYEFYTPRNLVKHEGRLGFTCKPPDGCWEIWVLGSDESWEKMYAINNKEDDAKYARNMAFDDPTTRVMISSHSILFYKGNTLYRVASTRSDMFVYRSDFELTNLLGR